MAPPIITVDSTEGGGDEKNWYHYRYHIAFAVAVVVVILLFFYFRPSEPVKEAFDVEEAIEKLRAKQDRLIKMMR